MTETSPTTHALAPHLICAGAAAAIDFYARAFGATEQMRVPAPDGKLLHAGITINGAPVMLVDENVGCGMRGPRSLGGTPVTINLNCADADATCAQAVAAGATVVMPMEDAFWGDRYGVIEDPFGHRWALITPQRTMSGQQIADAARQAMPA